MRVPLTQGFPPRISGLHAIRVRNIADASLPRNHTMRPVRAEGEAKAELQTPWRSQSPTLHGFTLVELLW